MRIKLILWIFIVLLGCVPPSVESTTVDTEVYANLEDCEPCDLLLNFASSNYQNQDWRGAINNYNQLLKCNCGKWDPENTYKYMAYSYQQLNLLDSAAYVFNQGLKYTPDDLELLKMAGENSGRLENFDDQIYYFDKILSFEENNLEILELLSNVYRDQGMFEEQVNILNIWLKYDPTSKNANAEKKAAFSALGKDESDVDRERWESEPSNIQYGLAYINSLKDAGDDEKIIEVCDEILVYQKFNREVLKYLGDSHLNLYNEDKALDIYQILAKADPTNYEVALDISKILANKEQYQDALDWAEKAIRISGKNGKTLYQRGEVFYDIAESCGVNENDISYWTRAVYELAWQDYRDALNMGYKAAKNRKIFLKENYITTIGTWFQLEPKTEIKLSECPMDCFSWINRTLKKRNL